MAVLGLSSSVRAQSIEYANSGNGQYRGSVALLDWAGTAFANGIQDGDQVTFSLPGCRSGALVATVSNVSDPIAAATYLPTDMKTWAQAGFADGYNTVGTGEALYGGNNADFAFTISWSMTLSGIPVTPDIFVIDAESTLAGPTESITATTNGTSWALAENINGSNYGLSGLGTSTFAIDETDRPSNIPLLLTQNATSTTVEINGAGRQAIAFGALLPCDYGDAPGYAVATHAFEQTTTGSGGLQYQTGGLYLGTTPPDAEVGPQPSAIAEGDDTDSLGDDEDGVVLPANLLLTDSLTIDASDITATGTGILHAWVDFDGNNQFDADEYASVAVNAGVVASPGLAWSHDASTVARKTYARFRLTTDGSVAAGSIASDGEVEDYELLIIAAPITNEDPVVSSTVGAVTVDPLANDTDADGTLDPTSVVLTGTGAPAGSTLAPDGKTLTVPGEGVWTVATNGEVTFTPEAGIAGDPTAAPYTVADNDGNISSPANISIDFGDAPIANEDPVVSSTVGTVTVDPLANDTDADGTLDPTSVVLTGTGAPAGSMLAPDGKTLTVPGEGVWTVATNGEVTFTPEAGIAGDPTTAPYTVADDAGNVSNEAAVTIQFGEAPVATSDTMVASGPGPVSIDPLANDNSNDPLDPTSVVLTGTGALVGSILSANGKVLTVPDEGEWRVDPTSGIVTFTPAAGFSGTPMPATYRVSNVFGSASNEATLSVTVAPPLAIVANPDGPLGLDGSNGGISAETVLTNDTLGGDPITDPSLVTLTTVSSPNLATGSLTLNPDGTITVASGTTPGTDTVVYKICEVANPTNCGTAQVEIIVLESGSLIMEIEEDLTAILSEDLANTLTQQSNQISGYSADALDRLRNRSASQCLAAANVAAVNILFDVDRAIIKSESQQALDEIGAILINCAGAPFEIAGHTDSDASDAYNLDLSQRRVTAVLRALTERGVDTTGYIARGYGESQPISSNATEAGKAQNRYVEFRSLTTVDNHRGPCEDRFRLLRTFNLNATANEARTDGKFLRDEHECITDRREVFEGSLSFTDTNQGQTQTAINMSYRREQYHGRDNVFGYFVGLYGSRSDVRRRANGKISGIGLNAGVYGANHFDSDLFVDFYLGAATGRHSFDLAFDRSIGTIDATGDYFYFAGFAGAALSGQVELGDTTLTPRIGFDYIYTPSADVNVVAELGVLRQVGNLELDAISGGRVFMEVRTDHLIQDGMVNLWINPRVACYQSVGALNGACGFGGSIGIESAEQDNGLTYAFEIDSEWGNGYSKGSLSLNASRDIGLGVLSGDAGVTRSGNATLSGQYEIQF